MPHHNKQPVKNKIAKTPVVMQMEAIECGAACLTMILHYYGKWIPLEQVRLDCGVSRDGSNARNILNAAKGYGLVPRGYRMEPEALLQQGSFPCIIHWNFNHFVVLNGFKNGRAYINDPAGGSYSLPMQDFDEAFTGVCLMFEPGEDFSPSGSPKSILEFAMKRLRGYGSVLAFVFITTLIISLLNMITPVFSRVFIDRLITGLSPGWQLPFFAAFFAVIIMQLVAGYINAIYSVRLNGKMAIVGSSSYMWKVLNLPIEFFSQRLAGDIKLRQDYNTTVSESFVNLFAPLFINIGLLIFYLAVMVRYSILLSAIGVLSILVNIVIARIVSHKRINITRVMMRDSGKLYGTLVSGIEMMETIKSAGAEEGFFEKWGGYRASVNNHTVLFDRLSGSLGMLPEYVSLLSGDLILICGVYLCMRGDFTPGMVMAFQGFYASFMKPVLTLTDTGQQFQEMRTSMERIDDVMDYPEDENISLMNSVETDDYSKLSGRIELKNVTFGYSRLSEPIIEDFSLTIEPGMKIAIVGESGCGKSTLSKLISGLCRPWSGEILFDGKPLSSINRSVFSSSLAVVDQDIILFEDTIAANIRMWDESIEDFEVIMAARDAMMHKDIMEKEGGYGYRLSFGGTNLSGGQRQRLEIARVLAQDPTIIIMDEATSSLDAKTEYRVVEAIKDRGITNIVIAHRLSTIRDCDSIIVMDKGKIVESGTHGELYSRNGYYTRLVTSE